MRIIALLILLITSTGHAEVVHQSASGFHIRHRLVLSAEPKAVYQALSRVGRWWESAHSFSGDARNLSLEAKAGGCFCEQGKGMSIEHARVIHADKNKRLRLVGALGPLQELAVSGTLSFTLKPETSGTELLLDYRVSGHLADEPKGLAIWAGPVDSVLGIQMARLQRYLTSGSPEAPAAAAP